MEMKNICGKIPIELHAKVREEIEYREISTQEFIQQVIEEHFMEKGVDAMAARTIAVQVTEELFRRLKAAVTWKGCKQKDFLINVITKAIEDVEAEMEQKASQDVEQDVPDLPDEESGETWDQEAQKSPEEIEEETADTDLDAPDEQTEEPEEENGEPWDEETEESPDEDSEEEIEDMEPIKPEALKA